jgi:hypothetical protein
MPKPAQWHLGSDQGEALDLHAPRVMLFITVGAANRPSPVEGCVLTARVCHVCIRRLESVNGAV